MNIGILSGKGGTGKTTVATNLAIIMESNYIDCDVEEPNGFIFLKPSITNKEYIEVDYPYIDKNRCIACGICVKTCQFNALGMIKNRVVVFEKLCKGCGACQVVCEEDAITYKKRTIGVIEEGKHHEIICKRGILDVGEPAAPPLIRKLLKELHGDVNIIDFSPGTSCNVVNALRYIDGAILVVEPTKFGFHDMKMTVQLIRQQRIPFGVIINKHRTSDHTIEEYCKEEGIKILGSIPYSKRVAEIYSNGEMLIETKAYDILFRDIKANIEEGLDWS